MLDRSNFDQATSVEGANYHLFEPAYYLQLIKRRFLIFVIPFVLIAAAGVSAAFVLPPTYLAEGKVLVQSQQIPTELVRATVTTLANERIQVIEQRLMTRDNLLAIADKFRLYADQRSLMSPTEVVERMRKNAQITPLSLLRSSSRETPTIAFTVGFQHSDRSVAARVANELMTRILNEDLKDRTLRATDTTKFLTREVQRLQAENAAIDARISSLKQKVGPAISEQALTQLNLLRNDLVQKRLIYSEKHPSMAILKRQIEAAEQAVAQPVDVPPDQRTGLDSLEAQRDALQKNVELAVQKLSAARLGETLERDQQSEKLEVIEQPTTPSEPIRPNRPKIIGLALALALLAGGGFAFIAEFADKAVRRSSDIFSLVDSRFVISLPYIATGKEVRRQKLKIRILWASLALLVASAVVALIYLQPVFIDLMIARARVNLFK